MAGKTASKTDEQASTAICGFDADTILIRDRNLAEDLIGKVSFTQLFVLQALGKEPSPMQTAIVDAVLVTIMEHGLVPSAVASRLTLYGAPENFQGAVAAGLLGVGDRYAGTAGECGEILERIVARPSKERPQAAREEVRSYRDRKRPVPGFGHPIHRDNDPRVERLLDVVRQAGTSGEFIDAMNHLEAALQEVSGKTLVTNISAALAAAMGEAGIPPQLMRGIVLTARCAGLVGHVYEEMNAPAAHAMWTAAQNAVDYEP